MFESILGAFVALSVQSTDAPSLNTSHECKDDEFNQSIERAGGSHTENNSKPPVPVCEDRWRWQLWSNPPGHLALIGLREPFSAEVKVIVTVEANGRVSDCFSSIAKEALSTDPSKQSEVNRRFKLSACYGMRRYARFKPATDAKGRAIIGTYTTVIEYSY